MRRKDTSGPFQKELVTGQDLRPSTVARTPGPGPSSKGGGRRGEGIAAGHPAPVRRPAKGVRSGNLPGHKGRRGALFRVGIVQLGGPPPQRGCRGSGCPVCQRRPGDGGEAFRARRPSRTRKPCRVALPMAAIMAKWGWPAPGRRGEDHQNGDSADGLTGQCPGEGGYGRAITTIQVAQRSASPTILAFPASADWTRRTIRWMELSCPPGWQSMSKEPNSIDGAAGDRIARSPCLPERFSGHDRPIDRRGRREWGAVQGMVSPAGPGGGRRCAPPPQGGSPRNRPGSAGQCGGEMDQLSRFRPGLWLRCAPPKRADLHDKGHSPAAKISRRSGRRRSEPGRPAGQPLMSKRVIEPLPAAL